MNKSLDRRSLVKRGLSLAAAALWAPTVLSQTPSGKPIRLIVPYPPGGFTDTTARLIGQKLQERLGQTVVVDNRSGANGILGADAVAKAAPDGTTFGVVIAAHAANTTLYPKLPYNPRKDLAAVSLIGLSPLLAAVNNSSPIKNAADLIAYARANPGAISYGSSGNG
jgi:tripartite-type tricarboxylate transporter receptor subunit TctC